MNEAYWCPDWYPAGPAERPCDRFFTAGLYLLDVDAHQRELEPTWEGDPDEIACRRHDSHPDKVSDSEWANRLVRARALAAARGWLVPEPERWDDPAALGPVVGGWDGECGAHLGYETCHQPVRLVAVERAGRIYYKAICAEALGRAGRPDDPFAQRDFLRTDHLNRCLPYMPPNH